MRSAELPCDCIQTFGHRGKRQPDAGFPCMDMPIGERRANIVDDGCDRPRRNAVALPEGGTAINRFEWDLSQLSVDIDLT